MTALAAGIWSIAPNYGASRFGASPKPAYEKARSQGRSRLLFILLPYRHTIAGTTRRMREFHFRAIVYR